MVLKQIKMQQKSINSLSSVIKIFENDFYNFDFNGFVPTTNTDIYSGVNDSLFNETNKKTKKTRSY